MTSSVFSSVRYYVIDSNDSQLVEDLKALGATSFPALTDSLKFAISDTGESAEVYEAEELIGLHVVTSLWVRQSMSKNAFLPFKPFHPKFKKIFKGLTVVISELSPNDVLKLTAHLTILGANCSNILNSKTTHLILGRASGFLYDRCKVHFPGVLMVSPDWIVECVKGQELIDCESYNVELLIKPAPPKPPIMPKPTPAPVQLIDQSAQKQIQQGLASHLGGIGASVECYRISPEAVRHVFGIQSALGAPLDGVSPRILSTNASVIGFTASGVPVVSQSQATASFHQQFPHLPEPKPTKSSSKSKANKHPSEQGLNEEQKDAIVMLNVKTILGSQANRNKDNSSNRGDGIQMPGAFLPTGSTPIATVGTQRKPKSPKSPANRGVGSSGGAGSSGSSSKGGSGGQKAAKSGAKRGELAEIAPVTSLGQVQQQQSQQQFTALAVDASGAASQLFPRSTATTVLVATANPGAAQISGAPGIPSASQQNGGVGQTPAFLLQQQQQHQQFQQQALLAAQNQFQKGRMGTPQQVQVSPLLLQGAQAGPGQARATTFIVRSGSDIQLGQAVTATESVQALLESGTNKEGLAQAPTQQVILQSSQASQLQQQQHLVHLQQQQQQQQEQRRTSSPSSGGNSGGVLSPVFIQGRQPQQQQYKQATGQMQVQVTGLQPQQQQQQQAIRPQTQRPPQGIRQALPPNQGQPQQQQYAQLAQQVKSNPHQMGQQQIIIQTSAGVQQVVTAQELSNAQYTQMRAVAGPGTPVGQSVSPRPTGIIGSPGYTQSQQVLTSNGSTSSILYHSSVTPAAAGLPADSSTAGGTPQDCVTYIASIPQQHHPQTPGGRLQPAMVQGQPMPQQPQQQTMINMSGGRPVSTVAGTQSPIVQAQQLQPQQAVTIQQGQFYGQSPPQQQQQQQRIIVQSPHPQAAQQQQQQLGVGGNFLQQQQQRQMLPQGQPPALQGVAQHMISGVRGPMNTNSQIRQMMATATVQQQSQQRHMVPPPPQYRGGPGYVLPVRPPPNSVTPAGVYGPSVIRAPQQMQQQQQQQINPAAIPQQQQQVAPPVPPAFQLPAFKGHIGFNCPTAQEDCLIGCVMMLTGYSNFPETNRTLWKKIIRSYGGEVVNTYDPSRVTHVIMDWKLGDKDLYDQALHDRKRVVTIYWLNDILAKGQMIPPFEIIHLPSAFAPFCTLNVIKAQIISITGFEGIEKLKVEAVIKQIGATYTDYLDEMNTFLVCKKPEGEKFRMARIWGVRCVNLRWLQDLYLGDGRTLDLNVSHKYLCFDRSDVTINLELRTAEVQDMMIGWHQGICVTPASWKYLAKLREVLHQEEMEEEAAAALQRQKEVETGQDDEKEKEDKCVLPSLTEEEEERARTGKLRSTLLHDEAEKVAAHHANLAATALAAQQQQQQQKRLYLVQTTPQGQLVAPPMKLPISAPPTTSVFPPVEMPAALTPASTSSSMQSQQPLTSTPETNPGQVPIPNNPLKRPLSPPSSSPPPKRQAVDISNPKSVPPFPIASPIYFTTQRPSSVDQLLAQTSQSVSNSTVSSNSQAIKPPTTSEALPTTQIEAKSANPPLQPAPTPPIKTEITIDPEVRIVFTDLTAHQHGAIVELLEQMPRNKEIAPYRLVDSVCDATHVVTLKLSRTLKTYHAMAFGVPIVSVKWIQACLLRGDWLAETEWLLDDAEGEQNLGIRMETSYARARERRLLGKPGLFSELEFWFSPMAHHRAVCEELVRLCGGRIRERRPTQKMALLSIPKQVIICHEEDANVASYLMRTKTGNRAVHHEEFILSGVLRQELDFESYQIQLVSLQFAELQAAINANMNNSENINPNSVNKSSTPTRNVAARTHAVEVPVAPLQPPPPPPPPPPVYMRPPPPPPSQQSQHPSTAPRSCVVLVSGAPENSQQSSLMYYIPSESTARSIVPTATTPETSSLTLRLPEGVSTVIVTGDEGLNAARVAAADAHVVASATAALTTNSNAPQIADSFGQGPVNLTTPQDHPQQQQQQPPSSGMM